ncbi:MAG: YbgA family protein [Myxococcota bacterium]
MTRPRDPAAPAWRSDAPVRVGVSSCLLGSAVRWDGGHKRDAFLTEWLAPFVEWVPVCPELELGMGVPREPVHLRREGGELRMLGNRSGADWTARMSAFAKRRASEIEAQELCGYVLKRGSPSCGLENVPVRGSAVLGKRDGRGLFAAALAARMPSLPIEEEGRLNDAALRENWIERVFAYRRVRALFAARWTIGGLVAFHAAHKLQLLAHSPEAYRALGRMVARAKQTPRAELRASYERAFMRALAVRATRGRHVKVLEHCVGYLRGRADASVRASLAAQIADYRAGCLPLIVPVTMLRHYAVQLELEYLAQQLYLDPHPNELMLRNHA